MFRLEYLTKEDNDKLAEINSEVIKRAQLIIDGHPGDDDPGAHGDGVITLSEVQAFLADALLLSETMTKFHTRAFAAFISDIVQTAVENPDALPGMRSAARKARNDYMASDLNQMLETLQKLAETADCENCDQKEECETLRSKGGAGTC